MMSIKLHAKNVAVATLLMLSLSCSKEGKENNDDNSQSNFYNEGLSEGINYGIAANYVNDKGLQFDQYVVGYEDFESGQIQLPTEEDRFKNHVKVVQDDPNEGTFCGEQSWTQGYDGPTTRFLLPEHIHKGKNPTYFIRMYIKHDESVHPYYQSTAPESGSYASKTLKGFGFEARPASGNYNDACNGTNWYNAKCQFTGWGPSQRAQANDKYLWVSHIYSYNAYPKDAVATLGDNLIIRDNPWYRFSAYAQPFEFLKFNRWYCFELGMYLNTPGKHDGEIRLWIDGILQSRTTKIRFRDIQGLFPTHADINLHRVNTNFPHIMKRYVDNVVISTRYIGPIKTE
jgi:hypothetical protein